MLLQFFPNLLGDSVKARYSSSHVVDVGYGDRVVATGEDHLMSLSNLESLEGNEDRMELEFIDSRFVLFPAPVDALVLPNGAPSFERSVRDDRGRWAWFEETVTAVWYLLQPPL
jgi:hypothetical protein